MTWKAYLSHLALDSLYSNFLLYYILQVKAILFFVCVAPHSLTFCFVHRHITPFMEVKVFFCINNFFLLSSRREIISDL